MYYYYSNVAHRYLSSPVTDIYNNFNENVKAKLEN